MAAAPCLVAALSMLAALPLAAISLPLPGPSADPASRESILKECKDSIEAWNIGFALLADEGVPAGSRALASALPKMWRQAYSASLEHRFDDATRLRIATTIRQGLLDKAREGLSQAYQARDEAWLQGASTPSSELQSQAKIAAARQRLDTLRALEPVAIPIVAGKKLVVAAPVGGDADGLFPAVPPGDAPPKALGQTLQSLVYGSLGEIDGYLVLRLAVWDWVQERQVWQDDWVLDPKTAQDRAGDQLEALALPVLGRASAGLELAASPKAALVTVLAADGATVIGQEPGGGSYRFLPPGRYEVEMALDGYRTRREAIVLEAGGVRELSWELEAREGRSFSLASDPPGARVYYGNRYLGVTPAEVPVPDAATTVSLVLEGHRSTRLVVPADPPAEMSAVLLRDLVDWKAETRLRRDRLFDSLAAFGFAILPPLFLDGLFKNLRSTVGTAWTAGGALSQADYDRLAKEGNIFYFLGIGSWVLTASLGVNFGIDLYNYLTAADLASGR
jgi:hypothetical protein